MNILGQILVGGFISFMLYLMACTIKALLNVRRRGVAYTQQLMDRGATFQAMRDGTILDSDSDYISTRVGMRMWVDKDGILHVKETRMLGPDEY